MRLENRVLSENLRVEGADKPSGGAARLSGIRAVAAAGPVLFAAFGAVLLTVNGAPAIPIAIAALSAAPLAAMVAAAASGGVRSSAIALATLPIALAALWLAWATGGGLSPALPWIIAAAVNVGLFGGRHSAAAAAGLGVVMAGALAVLPEPSVSYEAFRSREERELTALVSWGLAAVSAAAGVWAAIGAWAEALPPLRHPTILARQALSQLAQNAGACALRIGGDGRIVQALGAVDETLDLPREDIKGLPITEILHPDDAAATAAHLAAARNAAREPKRRGETPDGASFDPLTLRIRTRLGGFRWIEGSFSSAAGFPAPQGVGEDGDAILVLRERWRPLSDDLAPQDDDRSAFLAQIGGSLRDELTEVVGYAEIMKTELFGPLGGERYREYARLAHDSGERLLERIEELLDLSSLEAGGRLAAAEIADPTPLIDGAVRLVRSPAERAGVSVKADIPADTPHVRIDRRALRRVLVNLLLDAVRRGSIGDRAHLRVSSEDGAIHFVTTLEHGHAPALDVDQEAGSVTAGGDASRAAVEGAAEAARLAGEARFGRLVAHSFAERLGGALVYHADAAAPVPSEAEDDDAPRETVLAEAILPLEPPAALEDGETRPKPIAAPRERPRRARTEQNGAAKTGKSKSQKGQAAGPMVVAPPSMADDGEVDSGPLSAEKQTEMAKRFEEDLKRERANAAAKAKDLRDNAKKSGAEAGDEAGASESEDEVDRPLFAPGSRRERAS